jgi:hypothetical protein
MSQIKALHDVAVRVEVPVSSSHPLVHRLKMPRGGILARFMGWFNGGQTR